MQVLQAGLECAHCIAALPEYFWDPETAQSMRELYYLPAENNNDIVHVSWVLRTLIIFSYMGKRGQFPHRFEHTEINDSAARVWKYSLQKN